MFVLLCWAAFIFFLACVASVFVTFSNRGRIAELERRVSRLAAGIPTAETRPATASPWTGERAASLAREIKASEAESAGLSPAFSWLRENWLLAIGSMFMIFAVGWLVRYSVLHDLIGPVGRIISGLILGMGIIGLAQYRIRTHRNQGSIFAALGSIIVLMTIFAGQKYYSMFTPVSSMAFMLMTTALTAFISVRFQAQRLSYAGLLMAGAVPLLVSTGSKDFIGLFSYLAVITAGTLWVVFLTGWRKNVLIALMLVFFYSMPVLDNHSGWFSEPWIGLAFAFGFALTFFAVSLVAGLNATVAAQEGISGEEISDLTTAGLLGIFMVAWVVRVAPHEWQSLWLAAWMVLFSGASYRLFLSTANPRFYYVYGSVSALLLVAATAVQFSGPVLTLAFIAEAGILPLVIWKVLGDERKTVRSTLFMLLPLALSFNSLERWNWPDGVIFHSHFFVVSMITAVLAGLVCFLNRLRENSAEPVVNMKATMAVGSAIATYYAGHIIWRTLHAALADDDVAKTLALSIFMLAGLVAYFQGHLREMKPLRIYGGVIIGWVSFRLLFIDMPYMDVGGKIVTFFILGALLLGTAFIERRGKKGVK